ncbi:hypothetical protein [Rubripirellula obstinata]|nr:hypothetical protein [Rubripirellula obstinata]
MDQSVEEEGKEKCAQGVAANSVVSQSTAPRKSHATDGTISKRP